MPMQKIPIPTGSGRLINGKFFISAIIISAVLSLIGILKMIPAGGGNEHQSMRRNYNPARVCDDAWRQESKLNFSSFRGDYFDIKLHGGCWSGRIRTPDGWQSWQKQMVGNDPKSWVAFWYEGSNPAGPYPGSSIPSFSYPPHVVRLQGNGTIRFYRTDR